MSEYDNDLPFIGVMLVSTHILIDQRGSYPCMYKIDMVDLPEEWEGQKTLCRLVPVNATEDMVALVLTEKQGHETRYHREGTYAYRTSGAEPLYLTPIRLMVTEDAIAVIKGTAKMLEATFPGNDPTKVLMSFAGKERQAAIKSMTRLNKETRDDNRKQSNIILGRDGAGGTKLVGAD